MLKLIHEKLLKMVTFDLIGKSLLYTNICMHCYIPIASILLHYNIKKTIAL